MNFKIKNQIIQRIGEDNPANLSQEYLELNFEFLTEDWNGLTTFALFTDSKGLKYRVALTNTKVIVPNACLTEDKFLFSVYGVKDDLRITTNQIVIYLNESGYVRDVENDIPDDDPTIVEAIYSAIDGKANLSHTHSKSDITDFNHTHVKSEITDFEHNHDDRYYTEAEVDIIIENLKHELNNKLKLNADKSIIQKDDTVDFVAYFVEDGMPVMNKTVYFYVKVEE